MSQFTMFIAWQRLCSRLILEMAGAFEFPSQPAHLLHSLRLAAYLVGWNSSPNLESDMSKNNSSSERIIIVGGGFAGLSAAVRLVQSGFPVTLIEASKLGFAASSRNQGWLHSGAAFAQVDPHLAKLCYESLKQTIEFCPDCIEPETGPMVYCSLSEETKLEDWTSAWEAAGIPFQELPEGELNWSLPQVQLEQISWAMRLPDRSFRPDLLLSHLAEAARNAGVEIRSNTFVSRLLLDEQVTHSTENPEAIQLNSPELLESPQGDPRDQTSNSRCYGVQIGEGEELRGQLVILATGALSSNAFSSLFQETSGQQRDYQLVLLKTHLRAVRPGLSADPFYIVDGVGLNHLPHQDVSVFGTGRWNVVAHAVDDQLEEVEVQLIEDQIHEVFPNGFAEPVEVKDWAGITVQAMHIDQVEPGVAPLPTIVDHSQQPCRIENVMSIFPGRATLWAHLAEDVKNNVLEKYEPATNATSSPPWDFR